MIQIAPSILSADFTRIAESVSMVEEAGADLIHVDIMDGHFVPNLTFGPQLVSSLRKKTSLPIDVHLMVENPFSFIPLFQKAGANWISIHIEASLHLHRDIAFIKRLGCKAGLALNPATPLHSMGEIIQELDYILLMTVNPGQEAQEFIESVRSKIRRLKNWIKSQGFDARIEIDGGIKLDNMQGLIQDGAEIFVAGSGIFKTENPKETVVRMKQLGEKSNPS